MRKPLIGDRLRTYLLGVAIGLILMGVLLFVRPRFGAPPQGAPAQGAPTPAPNAAP